MTEKKILGILSIVFGGVGLVFSWMPFVNNLAFVFGVVGAVIGIIAIVTNRNSKKTLALIGTVISVLSIIFVLITQSYYSKQIDDAFGNDSSSHEKKSKYEKAEKATDKTSENSKDPAKNEWTFKNDVFSAGIMTYKLTKSEVLDSSEDGKKVLVIYADVTNNTDEEQDPSNIYMVMHAFQKTDTANKDLTLGMVKLDDNGNSPIQQQEDALNDKLLGNKTVPVAMVFTLENDNPVSVKFSNADFKTIGEKEYKVK